MLGVLTLAFTWARTTDKRLSTLAMAAFASVYFIAQVLAIAYPGTAFFDADSPQPRILGVAIQLWFDALVFALTGLGAWFALKKNARWA